MKKDYSITKPLRFWALGDRDKTKLYPQCQEDGFMLCIKNLISIFILVLVIILLFSFIDYLAHSANIRWAVPDYYFPHKIIYGTVIGFITYLFIKKQKSLIKSLIFSAAISILLQINYYLQGYPKDFVFLFLGIHFIILFILSFIAFRFLEIKKPLRFTAP